MKIQFCGAARTVTGSCYYLESYENRFIVDCGAFQGPDHIDDLNREPFPFDPAKLDYVFLTHAHYDHCGRLPLLVKQGFRGKVICTQPTRDLAQIVLMDSAKIQKEDYKRWQARAKRDNRRGIDHAAEGRAYEKNPPLYTEEDVQALFEHVEVYPYGNSVSMGDNLEFRMRDAGHILGSASFEFWLKNSNGRDRKVVFSGDLGQPGQRIVKDPDFIREADYVICESTYGNRLHKSKDDTVLELLRILRSASEHNGVVLIPSFAIERTQELLYELNAFYEKKLLTNLPVYLDSPMASKATAVFQKYPTFYDDDARRLLEKGDDPFDFPGFHQTESVDDSKRLVEKRGVVVIAGSGMMTGGRIIHHALNNLEKAKTHVIFVGYQVRGTLGRKLIEGEPEVYVKGKRLNVKAKIHTLGGFSAHGDERDLRYWLRSFGHSPRRIFITHGEESVALGFAKNIKQELKVDTYVPQMNEVVDLD